MATKPGMQRDTRRDGRWMTWIARMFTLTGIAAFVAFALNSGVVSAERWLLVAIALTLMAIAFFMDAQLHLRGL